MWRIYCLLLWSLVNAHQAPSFPGQDAHKPPEVHHQNLVHNQQQNQMNNPQPHIHNQPPPAQANTPPHREFGGEQAKDAEHIKEHLDGKVDPTANMTPEELQFHYFNMHDLDRNGLLDGIELIKAITHFHEGNVDQQPTAQPLPALTDTDIERMLDPIFESDDLNRDGFISYAEFSKAQKQREEQARRQHQQQQQQQQRP